MAGYKFNPLEGTFDLVGSGGSGGSYTFENGLTEGSGTVKLGGEVEDGTALTLGNSGLTFHEVDLAPLTGQAGVGHGASLETELDVPGLLSIKSGVGTITDLGVVKLPVASIYATYRDENDTETVVTTGPATGGIGIGSLFQAMDGSVLGNEQFTADRWSVFISDGRGEDEKTLLIEGVPDNGFQFEYGNHELFFQNGRIENLGDGTEPDHAVNKSQLDTKQDALPTPPSTGTFVLKSVDGMLEWVAEG